jgi:hypothetical protein
MKNSQPKTVEQLRAIFGLGKNVAMAKEDLEELAFDITGGRTERLSELTFDEANAMITRLGGDAFPSPSGPTPRRTENYRKQKAGVKTLVTTHQLNLMETLWFKVPNRTAAGLVAICQRVNKGLDRPRTTEQCNRVIEAVKSMNAREAANGRRAA